MLLLMIFELLTLFALVINLNFKFPLHHINTDGIPIYFAILFKGDVSCW
jgi:hypothetical protein